VLADELLADEFEYLLVLCLVVEALEDVRLYEPLLVGLV
jgi:hypothetical protein